MNGGREKQAEKRFYRSFLLCNNMVIISLEWSGAFQGFLLLTHVLISQILVGGKPVFQRKAYKNDTPVDWSESGETPTGKA